MKKTWALVAFIIIVIVGFAHYILFRQETNCMLIRFSNFKKDGNIYYRANTPEWKIEKIKSIQQVSESKVKTFWTKKILSPYNIIYCNNEQDFRKYGSSDAPAATQLKMGAYIVLKDISLDTNILAHEISHTVLYNSIGWYKTKFKIPTWFDEGLAMQVDDRDYYSIDTLKAKINSGTKLPVITNKRTPKQFYSGSPEEIMLNYSAAKFRVAEWLKSHSPGKFINAMINGMGFDKSFSSDSVK